MSNSIPEIEDTKCVFIFGYNAADSHPIVARRIVNAKQKGAKIIVVDPRMTESARIADLWLPIRNGSNMALVNAFGNVLIEEKLYNRDYVENYTEGFEAVQSDRGEVHAGVCREDHRHAGGTDSPGHADVCGGAQRVHSLWHGRDALRAGGGRGQGVVGPGPADGQLWPAQCGHRPGARPEQRAGRLRSRGAAQRLPRLSARHR